MDAQSVLGLTRKRRMAIGPRNPRSRQPAIDRDLRSKADMGAGRRFFHQSLSPALVARDRPEQQGLAVAERPPQRLRVPVADGLLRDASPYAALDQAREGHVQGEVQPHVQLDAARVVDTVCAVVPVDHPSIACNDLRDARGGVGARPLDPTRPPVNLIQRRHLDALVRRKAPAHCRLSSSARSDHPDPIRECAVRGLELRHP